MRSIWSPTIPAQIRRYRTAYRSTVFANSATPTRTDTEKAAYAVSNNFGGMDVDALTHEIALAGLVMILFLTANVIAQSVRERFAEFATLRALGLCRRRGDRAGGAGSGGAVSAGRGLGRGAGGFAGAPYSRRSMPPGFGLPMPTMSRSGASVGLRLSAFVLALPAPRCRPCA